MTIRDDIKIGQVVICDPTISINRDRGCGCMGIVTGFTADRVDAILWSAHGTQNRYNESFYLSCNGIVPLDSKFSGGISNHPIFLITILKSSITPLSKLINDIYIQEKSKKIKGEAKHG